MSIASWDFAHATLLNGFNDTLGCTNAVSCQEGGWK